VVGVGLWAASEQDDRWAAGGAVQGFGRRAKVLRWQRATVAREMAARLQTAQCPVLCAGQRAQHSARRSHCSLCLGLLLPMLRAPSNA